MGNCNTKILQLIFFFVSFCAFSQANRVAAELTDFAYPEYRNNGRDLQYIIYGRKAVNLGDLVKLTDPRLDLIYPGMDDITKISPVLEMVVYPISESSKKTFEYWQKYPTSQAVIFALNGVYQKTDRILRSEDKVYFRSREMDIDGIGFDAFFKKRFIHVRNNVHVVIRLETLSKYE